MKKRILAIVLLIAVFISLTLSSCKSNSNIFKDVTSILNIGSQEEDSSEFMYEAEQPYTPSSDKVTIGNSSLSGGTEKNQENSHKVTETMPTVPIGSEVQVEETVVTDENIKEPVNTEIIESIKLSNSHKAISEEDYYQYNSLNEKEKKLYKCIVDTIHLSKNIVDTSDLNVNYDDVAYVFQKVLADYPQFFYVSRNCLLAYGTRGRTVRAMVLLYTDGNITDEFDNALNPTKMADRGVINRKVSEFQAVIESVISQIPAEMEDVLKEKIIHDYIVKTVEYDYNVAENIDTYGTVIPHAFDLYGATVKKLAVCEGYSKLFQYLCYSVGINATQVFGTAEGGNHMWNAVLISGKWYFIDITWNDANNIMIYSYFNLTYTQITKCHTIDSSVISIPVCNSTENSFENKFAICINNLKEKPADFENKISNIKATQSEYIYVVFEGYDEAVENTRKYTDYIQRYLLSRYSEFYLYLSKQGMGLYSQINLCDKYFILSCK